MERPNHERYNGQDKGPTYDVAADLFGARRVEHGVMHAAVVLQNRGASAAARDFDF